MDRFPEPTDALPQPRPPRGVKVAVAAALALVAVGVGLALAHAPASVARINRATLGAEQTIAHGDATADYCQGGETLPAHTIAVRASLQASIGPRVELRVIARGRTVAAGAQGAAWTGAVVSVPVRPLPATASGVSVCVSFHARNELLRLYGAPVPGLPATRDGARALPGSMRLEYLRAGTRSWASMLSSIATHMGLGRAFEGGALAYVVLALLGAVTALASTVLVRELR